MANDLKESKDKLLAIINSAVEQDKAKREHYNIGDKFRFIRDRLNALAVKVEEGLKTIEEEIEKKKIVLSADEVSVYVYLYNSQGLTFQTWKKMVSPSVMYEYSVNRPIYQQKEDVEAAIRSKANRNQHGYITIAVKKENVLPAQDQTKDSIGLPLLKVKEGSLKIERLIAFTHNEQDYVLNENGELIKKE